MSGPEFRALSSFNGDQCCPLVEDDGEEGFIVTDPIMYRRGFTLIGCCVLALLVCSSHGPQVSGQPLQSSTYMFRGGLSRLDQQLSDALPMNDSTHAYTFKPKGLFCWLVTLSAGSELDLVKDHYKHRRSLFACDSFSVFSDATDLHPIIATDIGELRSKRAPWGGWYNTRVFLHAWRALAREGRYARHQWTVKVDADTVFFPHRLHVHLQDEAWSRPALLKGGERMLGAVEVFSKAAVDTFAKRSSSSCTQDVEGTGEDGFVNACMEKLGVQATIDTKLLRSTTNAADCSDNSFVAFHPFVDVEHFQQCIEFAAH
mmetsp:Transcript_85350/g.166974  ORF Transcript_85350/g.166974 Transcript_85350/m.166974 type:complete len:316 (+) Transcript_85350:79-1026(+)